MKTQKVQDTVFGIIVLIIAAFYTIMTFQIKYKPGIVDGRTVPLILSTLMWVLGLAQLVFARKADGKELEKSNTDVRTVLETGALIILYIGLFELIGFLVTTMVYLFVQFMVLTPAEKKPNLPVYGIVSVAVSLFVYTIFRYGLDIILPQGIITFF